MLATGAPFDVLSIRLSLYQKEYECLDGPGLDGVVFGRFFARVVRRFRVVLTLTNASSEVISMND